MNYINEILIPYISDLFPQLFEGLIVTIQASVFSFILALLLGTVLAVIQLFNIKWLNSIINIFNAYFRATPLLIQLFIFYYGLPQVIDPMKSFPKELALIICLGLNSSAYISEILRGAVDSVDRGQFEASISFGMTIPQAMRRIILPQAAVAATPSIINSLLDIIKMTSLGMTVGIMDLMGTAQYAAATSYRTLETYVSAAVFYWILMILVYFIQKWYEQRISIAYER